MHNTSARGPVNSLLLRGKILELMKDKGLWEDSLSNEVPKTWEKYNDLVLFLEPSFKSEKWLEAGCCLWELICQLLKVDRIAVRGSIQNDNFRTPKAKILFGESGPVSCKDNGIKYSWNIERNMFCRGNVTERHRIAKLDCSEEVVVDLFAGIGYFTLPYLVHAKAKFVYACEWNPYALTALRQNLTDNGVGDRCTILEGDCRNVCPENVAHRINLGLIPSSEIGWKPACKALLDTGGILYVHHNVTSSIRSKTELNNTLLCENCQTIQSFVSYEEDFPNVYPIEVDFKNTSRFITSEKCLFWKKIEWLQFSIHLSHLLLKILEECRTSMWSVSVREINKVKSYAPHVDHLVFSMHCYPSNKS